MAAKQQILTIYHMLVNTNHLSYCTNIHAGNCWADDFAAIKSFFPVIKDRVSPDHRMGIGLRLSNESSEGLMKENNLTVFKDWLSTTGGYVYTINGFPYGAFHNTVVKENVHLPDWASVARKQYTLRLFNILAELLPPDIEGGISTSPLSYRHWYKDAVYYNAAKQNSTANITDVLIHLIDLKALTGKIMHLDIEPEPDGLIETGEEFIEWFEEHLLPFAIPVLSEKFGIDHAEAERLVKLHICLCYDVCHFAIGYEDHETFIKKLVGKKMRIGKIQISAAIKAIFSGNSVSSQETLKSLSAFNEPTYLHQVIAKSNDDKLIRYPDVRYALQDDNNLSVVEWRAHFHVPVSADLDGVITSTRNEILTVLELNREMNLTNHLEIETYTWEVLPTQLKLPLAESIINEMNWTIEQLKNTPVENEKVSCN